LAAESLLRDELKKANPSMTSVAAFRKAVYGDASLETTDLDAGRMIQLEVTTETEVVMEEDGGKLKVQAGECNEAELVTSDDAEILIGDSDGKKTGSDGFSEGGTSSSDGESVVSRGSRKRPADESPDRETSEMTRKEFPGNVTRSDAGCRIYVPPTGKQEGEGVRTTGVEIVATTGVKGVVTTGVEGVGTTGIEGVGTTGVGGVATKDVGGVTTTMGLDMPASTPFMEAIGERDATVTTLMTVVVVDTTIDLVPPTSVSTSLFGTSTEVRCMDAAQTIASQAAVLLIEIPTAEAVVDFVAGKVLIKRLLRTRVRQRCRPWI